MTTGRINQVAIFPRRAAEAAQANGCPPRLNAASAGPRESVANQVLLWWDSWHPTGCRCTRTPEIQGECKAAGSRAHAWQPCCTFPGPNASTCHEQPRRGGRPHAFARAPHTPSLAGLLGHSGGGPLCGLWRTPTRTGRQARTTLPHLTADNGTPTGNCTNPPSTATCRRQGGELRG